VHAEFLQQAINGANILYGAKVGIVKNGKSELLVARESVHRFPEKARNLPILI
jgi:hypothetical protein